MPARSLTVSPRSWSSALLSRCSEISSSSFVPLTPFNRCHVCRTAAATFFDSFATVPQSTSPSSETNCCVGSSTVSGSSRALAISRRSFGTASGTVPALCSSSAKAYCGTSSRSPAAARSWRARRSSASAVESSPARSSRSFPDDMSRSTRRCSEPKSMSLRMLGSELNSLSSCSASSASSSVRRTRMLRLRSRSRGYRGGKLSTNSFAEVLRGEDAASEEERGPGPSSLTRAARSGAMRTGVLERAPGARTAGRDCCGGAYASARSEIMAQQADAPEGSSEGAFPAGAERSSNASSKNKGKCWTAPSLTPFSAQNRGVYGSRARATLLTDPCDHVVQFYEFSCCFRASAVQ